MCKFKGKIFNKYKAPLAYTCRLNFRFYEYILGNLKSNSNYIYPFLCCCSNTNNKISCYELIRRYRLAAK